MESSGVELRAWFARERIVLDGAMGTMLEQSGATRSGLWSAAALLEAPQLVADVHRGYAAAGAEIVRTNTFRTNPRALRRFGIEDRGPELNRVAVELARSVCSSKAGMVVAGSIGPAEDCYEPAQVPSDTELSREHGLMAAWLRDAGVDCAWIETMGTIRESVIAAGAATRCGLAVVCSWILREDGALLGGESLRDALASVSGMNPLAIGVNCVPPAGAARAIPVLRDARLPVVVYAHIGNRAPLPGWALAQSLSPAAYGVWAGACRELGATIVGGCCGTTPEHIRAVASGGE